jgi:NADH:ubiquinone oxidoreductase subunit E
MIVNRYPKNYRQAGIIPLLDLAQRQCGGWLPLVAMQKVTFTCVRFSSKFFPADTRRFYSKPCSSCGTVVVDARRWQRCWRCRPLRCTRSPPSTRCSTAPRSASTSSRYLVASSLSPALVSPCTLHSINFHKHVQLCGTTPCMVCGSEEIKKTIEEHLNMHVRITYVCLSLSSLLHWCVILARHPRCLQQEGETTPDGLFTLREVECLGSCANAPMIQVRRLYCCC